MLRKLTLAAIIISIMKFNIFAAEPNFRSEIDLSGKWKCHKISREEVSQNSDYYKTDFDDANVSQWENVDIPMYIPLPEADRYRNAWYRLRVNLPENVNGKRALVRFEGAGYETSVWVNGEYAGLHRGLRTIFEMDVTKLIKPGGENLIAVKCINDGVYPHGSEWNPRIGIWLPVKLVFVPEVYVKRVLITPNGQTSSLEVEYWLQNETGEAKQIVLNCGVISCSDNVTTDKADFKNISLIAGLNKYTYSIKMAKPIYWDIWQPYLYNLKTTLKEGEKTIDSVTERFGFRTIETKGKRFYFNGRPIKFYGQTCYFLSSQNNSPAQKEERKKYIETITKPFGCNLLRYFDPEPQFIVAAADELGLPIYEQWVGLNAVISSGDKKHLAATIEEMKEWAYQIHNNPSVIMVSQTNEDWSHVAELNQIYEAIKPICKTNALIAPSAGLYSWANSDLPSCGADFIDFHNYTGNSKPAIGSQQKLPWTYLQNTVNDAYEVLNKIYRGKFDKPLIVGETAGQIVFSNSPQIGEVHKAYAQDKKKAYVLANQDKSSMPISWDLTQTSLAEYFDGRIHTEGYSRMNKRCLEELRRLDIVQGIIPNGVMNWFLDADGRPGRDLVDIFPEVYNPIFICLSPFDTNLFSGDKTDLKINIINDLTEPLANLKINLKLTDAGNNTVFQDSINGGNIGDFTQKIVPYAWKVPSEAKTGFYKLALELMDKEKKRSENKYTVYILQKTDLPKEIKTNLKVAVYLPEKVKNLGKQTGDILNDLKINYGIIKDTYTSPTDLEKELDNYDVLIIPAFYDEQIKNWDDVDPKLVPIGGKTINYWISNGGRLLALEQSCQSEIPWVPQWNLTDGFPNTFIDVAIPEHPVFTGLTNANFDTWNGNKGVNNRYLIHPMSENVVAAVTSLSNGDIDMVVAEAKIGNGLLVMSQILATDRYRKDSSATKYLCNLLSYVLDPENKGWKDIRGMEGQEIQKYSVNFDRCFYVNLKPYVNQGFKNTGKRGEEWTGWTDDGPNDLRHIPTGEENAEKRYWEMVYHRELKDKQIFFGVPFEIIEQTANNGKSCLILKGAVRNYFPEKVTDIAVNQKLEKLFFLHTCAWTSGIVGKYSINYADGSKEEISLEAGRNIADWWGPKDLPEAKIAWSGENPESKQTVGIYIMPWNNPTPEKAIKSIDFISADSSGTPILIAITGIIKD